MPKSDVHVLGVGYGARKLLLMPWFASSLANLPQLSTSLIAQGVQRMEKALVYMHECGLAHMDVKVRGEKKGRGTLSSCLQQHLPRNNSDIYSWLMLCIFSRNLVAVLPCAAGQHLK